MTVEVWSDVVCPWCYVGKRRLEQALDRFGHRDETGIVWRSFELDPRAPRVREGSYAQRLAHKYGTTIERAQEMHDGMTTLAASVGLEYHLDRVRPGNTFDAHRLLHLGADRGLQGALKERLLSAYFTEAEPIGDTATLERLAIEVGLDADEVSRVLLGDDYGDAVRTDERLAVGLGVTGVPFFVFDRVTAVAGAQDPELLLESLEQAWALTTTRPRPPPVGA